MASLLELGISTGKWDAGLKKAQSSLNSFIQSQGGLSAAIDKENDKIGKFVGMMGNMTSSAKTARGQMKDYKGTLEQLTTQYNMLTDAQKKTVGPEYLNAIDKLKNKFGEAKTQVEEFNRSLNGIDTSKVSGGGLFGGGKLDGMLQVFGGNVLTKIAGVGVGFAAELGDMVRQGTELARQGEGIRIAFERLGRGDILQGLREATHGTVTDLELMKAAVKFNDFKLPIEELGTMLAFAQQKAKDTGQSVDYMVDSIVTGLGRKSLMILDNLGLSATEIRDKMKETGDMTKAVGEIIREQMSKAGNYVETAADKAKKADVELKNAMEDLGRTFLPIQQAGESLWKSLEIGAINLINRALRPLINHFNVLKEQAAIGGDSKIKSDIDKLKGSNFKKEAYQMMLSGYFKAENKAREDFLKAQKGGMGSIKIWENKYTAAQNQRKAFQSAAYSIAYPAAAAAGGGGNSGSGGTTTTKIGSTPTSESIMQDWLTASLKGAIDLQKAKQNGDLFVDMPSIYEMMLPEIKKQILDKKDFDLGRDITKKGTGRNTSTKPETNQNEKVIKDISTITGAVGNIMGGIQSLGLELPEGVMQAVGVLQTMSGILSAILAITTAINATQEVEVASNFIPFHTGGTLRAATGTVVPGNFGYDAVPALLTSGETVLTKAQSGALAAELQDSGINGLHIVGEVEGEKIILVANRTFQRKGEGEIVTWKN
jgi:hypothetical protein